MMGEIKPYYQDELCTIYLGDCRDVLPQLEPVDLVLTDPPYGIDLDTNYSNRRSRDIQGRDYARIAGDTSVMNFEFLFRLKGVKVIFGANNFPQQIPFNSQKDGWICWDKRVNEKADKILGSPFEMAVVLGQRTYKIVRLQHCGVKNADGDMSGRFHPTQKPVTLIKRILGFVKGDSILDPFMGSGTTLRAAKDLGLRAIGIEISKDYCDIAIERLRQQAFNFTEAA